jgi:hypothetical protein
LPLSVVTVKLGCPEKFAGLLKRRQVPQKEDIYYIGRPALPLLLSHCLITDAEAERRHREHELKPDSFPYEMMSSIGCSNGSTVEAKRGA